MNVYMELPALFTALAVLAWCMRSARLPKPLEVLEKLGGDSRENLKALGKRLETLKVPISAELFIAGKKVIVVIPALLGFFLLADCQYEGFLFLFAMPMARKLPDLSLELLEKKRKEAILRNFPLMVDQVRIYANAVGYYTALKIVAGAMKGPLGSEMKVLSAEIELLGLLEAVNNFAARCDIPEVADFARIIRVEQTTGADISQILLNYSNMTRKRLTSRIKRKIKIQPILMSILPGILVIIFMMMFIVPMVTSIIQQINSIK